MVNEELQELEHVLHAEAPGSISSTACFKNKNNSMVNKDIWFACNQHSFDLQHHIWTFELQASVIPEHGAMCNPWTLLGVAPKQSNLKIKK